MLNTVTPALTYFVRANTDVSSLLSGTSVKSIISYVTDYVTKPALKTYQVFSSAYDVYTKNSELLGDDIKMGDKARQLIMKIVNSLASKMEIGSPMACLYLLDNPDHYTSHTFVPFWWKSYNGQYVAKSVVDDYIFRLDVYENLNLMEWVACNVKRKRKSKSMKSFTESVLKGEQTASSTKSKYVPFNDQHPLYLSHEVYCDLSRLKFVVPNFLGGSLPRRDQGDREYYCATMLTLFRPWRTGADLKENNMSWDESFNRYQFSPSDSKYMDNFNLRYECLDGRDDY
ncbi:hypothetical protein CPC08DRAFT_648747, partial [Agrocybe pediades]